MILTIYRLLTEVAAWPLRLLLRWRALRGKEDRARLTERRGIASVSRPKGRLVWCHAASVGESIALLPLIEKLCAWPDTRVLLTTGTLSSAQVMAQRLPERAIHQFAPWDRRGWVMPFLDHWQPDLAVRMESEIWPNTLLALHQRQVPVVVVNARLSAKSMRGWARVPTLSKQVFGSLALVVAQSETFAGAFQQLGAPSVSVSPNLKLSAVPLPVNNQDLAVLRSSIGSRPVWLAASTHEGEEAIALNVHRAVLDNAQKLLTIVAPRHPNRGVEIAHLASQEGWNVARRSQGDPVTENTDIYLADTLGELGLFFSLAPVVFMGKSLTATGGQNPVEPAHFSCAILFGPHMENFEDIAETMLTDGLAKQISDESQLSSAVGACLTDDVHRSVMSASAGALVQAGTHGLDQTAAALKALLPESDKNGL